GLVADIALHEDVARIALQRAQVLQIAGIGQQIQIEYGLIALGQPVENEIAADEAGTAGDKDHSSPNMKNVSPEIIPNAASAIKQTTRTGPYFSLILWAISAATRARPRRCASTWAAMPPSLTGSCKMLRPVRLTPCASMRHRMS